MEARARAAVARLQELSQAGADTAAPRASTDESETISRTLLLAQRTADATVADAQAEAERVVAAAGEEANELLEEARLEARREGEAARVQVEGEVQALLARRDFLESDVDHLEQYLVAQRERITEAVSELSALVQRVPNGLGDMRRPLLSAAADEGGEGGESGEAGDADSELAEISRVVEGGEPTEAIPVTGDPADEAGDVGETAGAGSRDEPTPPIRRRGPIDTHHRRRREPEVASSQRRRRGDHLRAFGRTGPPGPSVEPNGSGPSAPAQTSGTPPRRGASRVVPRSAAAEAAGSSLRTTTQAQEPERMAYPKVEPQPRFPRLEERVAERWREQSTFFESIARREAEGADEFVFYDGPPFANGLPHYGHLLTGYVKDAVPRYQTMRGQVVHRRFGWDCHGLPAEVEAERELGISGHPEINAFGIAAFNDVCRTSVLRYTAEWRRYVERQARWVDFENDYKTLDLDYMESVMWAFKSLWAKGLIYEGFRVLAYCWRCETPLSNTETRMDDVYRDRRDPALTVAFELDSGERLLAWTTTPWTLPANLALAVGPDLEYAVVERDGVRYVLAAARLAAYAEEFPDEPLEILRGSELVGRRYRPLFDFFADTPNAFQVLGADFVSTEEGTGIVHLAPGFGEDDQQACNAVGIPTVVPMDEHGRYTAEVAPWAGQHVFDANPHVTEQLREQGAVLRAETYDHSYPHCWRCEQPLVYRAISSWFVEVTKFRERMVELNEQITWVPDHLKHGSFGKWLENARDWSISRNRFWGSPIPVWRSDDPAYPRVDVYGSLAELAADFGVAVTDLHRPMIDELVRPNPDDPTGRSMMRRVPEVLDCWFESGSMPFAQVHYPFENRDWFEDHFPGDFIVEYTAQTRGWFYTLHVLATALFDRPAFLTCVSHGIVLGEDGLKMSKSLRNYPDPMEVFDTHGADAMRWYLLSSPILRGNDFSVTAAGLRDTARQILLPLWNAWYFLALYANVAGYQGESRGGDAQSDHVLDRYVLAKTRQLDRRHDRGDGRLRPVRRVRQDPIVRRGAHQLVHPPQPATVLGRRPCRDRHAAPGARGRGAGSPRRCSRTSPMRSSSGSTAGATARAASI